MSSSDTELVSAMETLMASPGWQYVIANLQVDVQKASSALCENPADKWLHGRWRGILDEATGVANLPKATIDRINREAAAAEEEGDA